MDRLSYPTRTVDALEPTAGRCIDIVTVWAEEFDSVRSGKIGTSTGDNVATVAVNAGAGAEYTGLVLVNLGKNASMSCVEMMHGRKGSPLPASRPW